MELKKYDLVIIGSGPGGYVAAIRAAQLNKKVAVVEKSSLGGVCLNWGCIPTKAIIKSAEIFTKIKKAKDFGISVENATFDFSGVIQRSRKIADWMSKGVNMLFKQNNIEVFQGFGKILPDNKIGIFNKENDKIEELAYTNLIVATGARPKKIKSFNIDRINVFTSNEALSLEKLPESIIIIGAGAIGIEFAYIYNVFGVKVFVVEMLPDILPLEDKEISGILQKNLARRGIKFYTGALVEEVNIGKGMVDVKLKTEKGDNILSAEKVLAAVGVDTNIENMNLEDNGVIIEKGFIKADKNLRTGNKNIYAIGDVIGAPLLAHAASAEGIYAVEKLAGLNPEKPLIDDMPSCVYCQPQVASVGLTETDAVQREYKIKKGIFPFKANGKSVASGDTTGIVKLIFDEDSGKLLGGHIIGHDATELTSEIGMAKGLKASPEDFLKVIHSHPTASEAIMEAAANSMGEAIHI